MQTYDEFLINKAHYKHFLKVADPVQYDNYMNHLGRLAIHQEGILDLVTKLIQNPKTELNSTLNLHWELFSNDCMQYLEMQEKTKCEANEDDDVLFPETKMHNSTPPTFKMPPVKKRLNRMANAFLPRTQEK